MNTLEGFVRRPTSRRYSRVRGRCELPSIVIRDHVHNDSSQRPDIRVKVVSDVSQLMHSRGYQIMYPCECWHILGLMYECISQPINPLWFRSRWGIDIPNLWQACTPSRSLMNALSLTLFWYPRFSMIAVYINVLTRAVVEHEDDLVESALDMRQRTGYQVVSHLWHGTIRGEFRF